MFWISFPLLVRSFDGMSDAAAQSEKCDRDDDDDDDDDAGDDSVGEPPAAH